MLSIGEVHNMGLNGRGGFHHNVYDRGIYGLLGGGNGNFNNAGGLNDFLHSNPYLPPAAIAPGPAYPQGSTSMGFQSDSFQFDVEVMPQVVDDLFNFPVGIVTTAPTTTATAFAHLQQQQPPVRESWMEPVGRGVKRECPVQLQEDHRLEQPARKKLDTSVKRPSDQADHILRERQRRDDMTSKFAVLESLLPTAPKRDRSTIVDDSIEYVKNLHHRIKLLQKRKEELTPNRNLLKRPKPESLQKPASPNTRKPVSPEEMSKIRAMLRSSLESMQVHTDMPNQVVINMVCRPQPRLQSNILQCLESLSLDVIQCSITKISHRLICIITAKPQEATTPTSGIVAALKYAMGSDALSS